MGLALQSKEIWAWCDLAGINCFLIEFVLKSEEIWTWGNQAQIASFLMEFELKAQESWARGNHAGTGCFLNLYLTLDKSESEGTKEEMLVSCFLFLM